MISDIQPRPRSRIAPPRRRLIAAPRPHARSLELRTQLKPLIQTTAPPKSPATKRVYAKPEAEQPRSSRFAIWLQIPLVILVIMFGSYFVQSAAVGQTIIVIYGLIAVFRNIPSRMSFMLALLSMVTATILLVGKGDVLSAENFATYTFLLLVVGVITLNRELRREGGRVYVRHK